MSNTTLVLIEDGTLLGPRRFDMGNSGLTEELYQSTTCLPNLKNYLSDRFRQGRILVWVLLMAAILGLIVACGNGSEEKPYEQSKIAFMSSRDGDFDIYVMNADGSEQNNLTNNPARDSSPAWSPDGKKIVFPSDRDGNYEIYVMDADGSGQKRLTNNSAYDGAPTWSPDGKKDSIPVRERWES